MEMEVLAVPQFYQTQYGVLETNKVKDWTSAFMPLASAASETRIKEQEKSNICLQNMTTNNFKNSINKKLDRPVEERIKASNANTDAIAVVAIPTRGNYQPRIHITDSSNSNIFHSDEIDMSALDELSLRLLNELRAAKSRQLTCTEVSLPCDLTSRIAVEIIRISAKEPCGIRGCTIFIEFEDEPNNCRRIASLKLDSETISTFEIYLTLRQDHRGWTALLPQFMKSLTRTITISPEFTIIKHKLYSPNQRNSYSYGFDNGTSTITTQSA